jgi:hypothetical protein
MTEPLIEIQHGKDPGVHLLHRPLGLIAVIAYKAIWGVTEIIGGFVLFYSSFIIASELSEDPQDRFMNWVVAHVHLQPKTAKEWGALIVLFGVGKLAIAIGLWFSSKKTRELGIAFFSLIGVFGFIQIIRQPSYFHLLALVTDLLILFYLWKILPKHLKHGHVS